jgi:hypothetical protein
MWQPDRAQWIVIVSATALLVLAWPPDTGRRLLAKSVAWAADPSDSLPMLPPPLPMGLDDDGDAVAAHDAQETAYYRARDRSALTRWRMAMKTARGPFDPGTTRQLLVGIAAFSALLVLRLNRRRT